MGFKSLSIVALALCCAVLSACGGGGSSAAAPPSSTPQEITLTALSPSRAEQGSKPITLTVFGVGFTHASHVIWNGTPLPTTYVAAKELQAPVSTADLAVQSGVTVAVSTPGWECKDCGLNFELDPPPTPRVVSLAPAGVTDGAPAFTLKVSGKGFIPASQVQWNGKTLPTTYVSSQELDVQVPADKVASVGTATVTVEDAVQGFYLPSSAYFMIGYTVTVLDLAANSLAWDPVHSLIYISLKDDGSIAHDSSIATYDPATGTLGTLAVTTPFEADRLAMTADASYLYAGIDGNSQVLRYALPGGALDQTINLPATTSGRAYPLDIEVQPGAPHSFATVIAASGLSVVTPLGGIQIYDDTTPRADPLPEYSPTKLYDSTSIQWSADGSTLYGADGLDTDFTFFVMHVDATGITSVDSYDNVFPDFYNTLTLDPATGYLFASDFVVIDPVALDYVYESDCIGYTALPDDTTGRAYYLDSSQIDAGLDGYSILSCDKATGKLISEIDLPIGVLYPSAFIRFGTDGLAFTTADNKVILVRGHFVAP